MFPRRTEPPTRPAPDAPAPVKRGRGRPRTGRTRVSTGLHLPIEIYDEYCRIAIRRGDGTTAHRLMCTVLVHAILVRKKNPEADEQAQS